MKESAEREKKKSPNCKPRYLEGVSCNMAKEGAKKSHVHHPSPPFAAGRARWGLWAESFAPLGTC
jgi:hypothetical protein